MITLWSIYLFQEIAFLTASHDLIHLILGNGLVSAAIEKDTIVTLPVILDNGIAGSCVCQNGYTLRIDARILHLL